MENFEWSKVFEKVSPYVVKITTPRGSGTGFLFSYTSSGGLCGIATASHVVNNSHAWEEPIRITHFTSGKSILIRPKDRAIFLDENHDTAAIVTRRDHFSFPQNVLDLSPEGHHVKIGIEVGWVGFPALSASDLCFFSGRISSLLIRERAYLVDGVAIHGVSGGPAFHIYPTGKVVFMGVVSAYVPNRATGESLPGLSVIRDVIQFQDLIKWFQDMDQAKEKETPPAEIEQKGGDQKHESV